MLDTPDLNVLIMEMDWNNKTYDLKKNEQQWAREVHFSSISLIEDCTFAIINEQGIMFQNPKLATLNFAEILIFVVAIIIIFFAWSGNLPNSNGILVVPIPGNKTLFKNFI